MSLTWSEYRITALEADDFAHPFHDYMLHEDEDGGDLVREHVGVGGCREPLTRHGDEVQAARQLVEETRMTCAGEICGYSYVM